jgi:hypothetical protein
MESRVHSLWYKLLIIDHCINTSEMLRHYLVSKLLSLLCASSVFAVKYA